MSKPKEWHLRNCALIINDLATPEHRARWADTVHVIEHSAYTAILEQAEKLERALKWLRDDTEHLNHNCGDELCPVSGADEALAEFQKFKEGLNER